ncbi:MAG: nicotinate phosphoribosyltransferase [Candidatus Thorarchaeota archaeon]
MDFIDGGVRGLNVRRWRIPTEDEILNGRTTDVYFSRTKQVLDAEGVNPLVYAEVTVSWHPPEYGALFVAGIDDVLKLFEGRNVNIYGLPEATMFSARDDRGVSVPVLSIEGHYADFAELETPALGFLCFTSGVVTKTAHLRAIAGQRRLLSFGARRVHPALSAQLEYAAYIGGCDGVSSILGAEMLGIEPSGTMPHALIVVLRDHVRAWQAFDRHIKRDVPRIALTDTYLDEVREAIMAAESVRDLYAVRLDTTGSRRGDMAKIVREVRWELDVRGYKHVKIFVSGGLDAEEMRRLSDAPVDGYGVGSAISNARPIDYAMDIVSLYEDGSWTPAAKRGKMSGRKRVYRCESCLRLRVMLVDDPPPACPECGKVMSSLSVQLMHSGVPVSEVHPPERLRERVLQQLTMIKR